MPPNGSAQKSLILAADPLTLQQSQSNKHLFNPIKKVEIAEKQMASQHSTSAADMDMIRRLKRLEKFELANALKSKMKPRLLQS